MFNWLRNLAWRVTPDEGLQKHAEKFGTKPLVGVYSYDKAIAGKRRSEERETLRRSLESGRRPKGQKRPTSNVTPMRKRA